MSVLSAHIAIVAILLSSVWLTAPAAGQDIRFRTVDADEEGLVVEITADWPADLNTIVDSTGISTFTADAASALSFGVPITSETYEMPNPGTPRLTVTASEYDEIELPAADSAAAREYAGSAAFLFGPGTSRERSVINLVARLLAYDAEGGTVRRYRSVQATIRFAAQAAKQGSAADDNPHLAVSTSVLADGVVYKIPVRSEGMYRIDRDFIAGLDGLGMSPDEIDPNQVQVFGNGGAPLPALNSAPRPADLIENAAYRVGGGDGSFDAGDAVIFYGKGAQGWSFSKSGWSHYVHPFANENYYFIKLAGTDAASVGEGEFPGYADAQPIDVVEGRYVRDYDEFMWSKENGTGHTWVSRTLREGGSRVLLDDVNLPAFSGGTVTYHAAVAIRSNPAATVFFESNGTRLAQERARRAVTTSATAPIAAPSTAVFQQTLSSGEPAHLSMILDPSASGAPEAAIDWLRLFYPKNLTASGDTLRFSTPAGESGRFEMILRGFSAEPQVWDVTEHGAIRRLGVRPEESTYRVQVAAADSLQPRELIAFLPGTAASLDASAAQRVQNQNLHGISGYPDFVIVSPQVFRASADELAEYRASDGLQVVVADVGRIYNEFSGGQQDVRAIRDYLRFLYERAPDDARRLKYALFFGDGHFNYRNLGDEAQRPELENWIPPYETEESYDPNTSYTSDDYFALLDADEGIWEWPGDATRVGTERVDIGIGRFPVQTPDEAAQVVSKLKHYENPETYGPWRTRYLFVADDAYNGIRPQEETRPDLHTQNADVVAELIKNEYPRVNLQKIYGISYTREFLNGWRLPAARRDILAALNQGLLVMNYSGHGGEFSLAQEEIFTKEDALALRNYDRLPIFVTATCSFGWWDLGKEQSAAESLLLNPEGGAVALLTTVRLVYTDTGLNILNVGLNRALNTEMFLDDPQGRPRRLGDILVSAKNTYAGAQGNNRKFNLLGDPTMRIGFPGREASIETVDGEAVAQQPRLRALDEVTVAGTVRTLGGDVDATFEGRVHLTVFDAARRVDVPVRVAMPQDFYSVREDLIWRGTAPVQAGRFEATFVVPKDISYSNESGRISAYAQNSNTHAVGFTEEPIVGGTAADPPDDHTGPEIALFLNDTTFVSGGMTNPSPRLIVKLRDASGINTVGAGVGHEMLLVVDGEEQHAVDISENFESEPDSYRSGTVTYSLEEYPVELGDGPHTLSVRAWDVLNNSTTSMLDFFVSSSDELVLQNVFNYPNPTSGHTRFIFEHNQPTGTAADVQVRIYTLAGRPIRTISTEEALPSGVLTAGPVQVPWDGRDEDLNPLASGIYLYKIRVAAEGMDGERHVSERVEKLAVIR